MSFQNYISIANWDAVSAFSPITLIYLMPLMIVLSVLGWMLHRRRQYTQTSPSPAPNLLKLQPPPLLLAQPPRPFAKSTRKSPPPLPTSPPVCPKSTNTAPEPDTTTQATFSIHSSSTHSPASRRQCPTCHQFFELHLEFCPNDACALPPTHYNFLSATNNHHKELHRTQCTACGRRYEDGTRYCYVDGTLLIDDTATDAANANPLKVCRICGTEATTDQDSCPYDNTELTLIDPSNLTRFTPAIPLLICSKCRQYAMPGATFCPNDGELLTPLPNAKFAALPASGFGPRRKLCRKCGTRYSNACTYCSQDGTPLTEIH